MSSRLIKTGVAAILLGVLSGCGSNYSPDTYSATAVQQANKVERGVVVGFREVKISATGTVGAVTGGAAGGILGAQAGTSGMDSALGGVAGTAVGGLLGAAIEHASGDSAGWEYIVRKPNGELISVTQHETQPLPIGQKVLVIAGNQARIVPDYSVALPEAEPAKASSPAAEEAAPKDASLGASPKAGAIESETLDAPSRKAHETPAEETISNPEPDQGAPAEETASQTGETSAASPSSAEDATPASTP